MAVEVVAHFVRQDANAGPVGVAGAVHGVEKIGVVEQEALAVVHHGGGIVDFAGGPQLKARLEAHCIGDFPNHVGRSRRSLGLGRAGKN
ncbi:hypothetical protein ACFQT0_22735 [Hymenobacter humi]|uniref:Uncharacterized protein n=1 Tax=Hymenobacter humi TaxID=1411620 RepID=A0ABW2UCB5_9BACT